jgi:hypothetical protein
MDLIYDRDLPRGGPDGTCTFHMAAWHHWVLLSIGVVGGIASAYWVFHPTGHFRGDKLLGVAVLLVCAAIVIVIVIVEHLRAARRPSNWLLRMERSRVMVHLRTWLNWRLPERAPTVLALRFDEMASVRIVKDCLSFPAPRTPPPSGASVCRATYLEITLKANAPEEVRQAFHNELYPRPDRRQGSWMTSANDTARLWTDRVIRTN